MLRYIYDSKKSNPACFLSHLTGSHQVVIQYQRLTLQSDSTHRVVASNLAEKFHKCAIYEVKD
jgi:hypothetical protein